MVLKRHTQEYLSRDSYSLNGLDRFLVFRVFQRVITISTHRSFYTTSYAYDYPGPRSLHFLSRVAFKIQPSHRPWLLLRVFSHALRRKSLYAFLLTVHVCGLLRRLNQFTTSQIRLQLWRPPF